MFPCCTAKADVPSNPLYTGSVIATASAGAVTLIVCSILAILISQEVIALQISISNLMIIGSCGAVAFWITSLAIKFCCCQSKEKTETPQPSNEELVIQSRRTDTNEPLPADDRHKKNKKEELVIQSRRTDTNEPLPADGRHKKNKKKDAGNSPLSPDGRGTDGAVGRLGDQKVFNVAKGKRRDLI